MNDVLQSMDDKMPKISVLLPAYNHVNYIEECLESVLNQTYKNIEFIVGDDASDDGTVEKIMKYEEQIDEIHLFEENLGGTTGYLLERATGEYIAIINSDDVWCAQKLEKQIKALKENTNAVACFTWCDKIDEAGNILEIANPFNVKNRTKEQWMNYFYNHGNCMAYPSILIRKDVFVEYTEKHGSMFRQLPDFYKWIRIVQKYEIVVLEEKLTRMRVVNEKFRKNVSSVTSENLVRHLNEESYIWYKIMSDMEDGYFVEAFRGQMVDTEATDKTEILCEKLFVLLQARADYCKLAAFFFYYDHCDEIKELLEERYSFTRKDMFQLLVTVGPAKYIL